MAATPHFHDKLFNLRAVGQDGDSSDEEEVDTTRVKALYGEITRTAAEEEERAAARAAWDKRQAVTFLPTSVEACHVHGCCIQLVGTVAEAAAVTEATSTAAGLNPPPRFHHTLPLAQAGDAMPPVVATMASRCVVDHSVPDDAVPDVLTTSAATLWRVCAGVAAVTQHDGAAHCVVHTGCTDAGANAPLLPVCTASQVRGAALLNYVLAAALTALEALAPKLDGRLPHILVVVPPGMAVHNLVRACARIPAVTAAVHIARGVRPPTQQDDGVVDAVDMVVWVPGHEVREPFPMSVARTRLMCLCP